MRGRILVPAVALAALVGCTSLSTKRNPIKYQITIHPTATGTCDVEFSKNTVGVRRGDTVTFVMNNECGADDTLGLNDRAGLFKESFSNVKVPAGGQVTKDLTVKTDGLVDHQHYKCDVIFKGANHDPDFEVMP